MTEFRVGEVVWAKIKGFPFWPAIVQHPSDATIAAPKKKQQTYYVQFLEPNNKNQIAWVDAINMMEFQPHVEEMLAACGNKGGKTYTDLKKSIPLGVEAHKAFLQELANNPRSTTRKRAASTILDEVPVHSNGDQSSTKKLKTKSGKALINGTSSVKEVGYVEHVPEIKLPSRRTRSKAIDDKELSGALSDGETSANEEEVVEETEEQHQKRLHSVFADLVGMAFHQKKTITLSEDDIFKYVGDHSNEILFTRPMMKAGIAKMRREEMVVTKGELVKLLTDPNVDMNFSGGDPDLLQFLDEEWNDFADKWIIENFIMEEKSSISFKALLIFFRRYITHQGKKQPVNWADKKQGLSRMFINRLKTTAPNTNGKKDPRKRYRGVALSDNGLNLFLKLTDLFDNSIYI